MAPTSRVEVPWEGRVLWFFYLFIYLLFLRYYIGCLCVCLYVYV